MFQVELQKTTKTRRGGCSVAANSKHMEPGIEKIVQEHFSGRRVEQSDVSERKKEEVWRECTRTDGGRGKVAECRQSTGMKELPV